MTDAVTIGRAVRAGALTYASYDQICERRPLEALSTARSSAIAVVRAAGPIAVRCARTYCEPEHLALAQQVAASRLPSSMLEPELSVVALRDCLALDLGILVAGGRLLPGTFRRLPRPHAHCGLSHDPETNTFRLLQPVREAVRVSAPALHLLTENDAHFGHFLLETLPRLWIADFLPVTDFLIVVNRRLRDHHLSVLRRVGIDSSRVYVLNRPTVFDRLLVPSPGYVLEHAASPAAARVWSRVAAGLGPTFDSGRKLYVSRTRWTKQRVLANEDAVQALFVRRGYSVVHPEELSTDQQIAAFSKATAAAGPTGSGLYNAVFMPDRTRVFCATPLHFTICNHQLIGHVKQQDVAYAFGSAQEGDRAPRLQRSWSIDIARVSDWLDDWEGRAAAVTS